MKRRIALTLASAMMIAMLAACGGGTTTPPAGSTTTPPAGSTTPSVSTPAPATPQDLVMGTGSTGGTYFALGGAMANAMNNRMDAITITAQSTGASVENMNLINALEMDLGIAMNNVAADAWDGIGAFNAPAANVRAIGVVYNEVYQIVANASTGATEVDQLKGKKVAVGPAGSGTVGLSGRVFAAAGLDINKDIQPQSDSFGDAATKMQDGHIDAACNVLAVPASSIIEMTTSMDLSYVNISDEILAEIQKEAPYFTRYTIPAGTYSNTEDVQTITCKAALYCRADLDEETVYQITKAFYESAEDIGNAHATGKEINVEGALEGITTPIHPGAARYFQEAGLTVPAGQVMP